MTTVDWIAVAVIGLAALNGLRRGLVGGVFSLAGIAAGAYFGARLAPQFLSGSESPYTPLVALGGAVVLGVLLQSVAAVAANAIRGSLFVVPPLRALDSLGGVALGAVAGAAIIWVAGAVALHIAGSDGAARGGPALAHPRRDQRAGAALAPARRDRARRPVRRHPRAASPRRATRPRAAPESRCGGRARQRAARDRVRVRARHRGLRLGCGARTSSSRTPMSSPG